jgi:Ohr subfamily peroxiredoxin
MATPNPILYTASASATGGRDGRVTTDDGSFDLAVTMPKGLGGAGAAGTNPEQLFAAGYAACFGSALALVARQKKIQTGPVTIDVKVSIGPVGAGFGLAVALTARLPEVSPEIAQQLIEAAHQVCPYSNATRGNIDVTLNIV